jgi:membrane peptidoglycan carboxypeptidase
VTNEDSTVVDTRQDANRSYFSEFVKEYLRSHGVAMGLGATEEEVMARLYRGGLKIYTTLDKNDQLAAERAAAEQMPDNATGITAAVLSLDTQSGAIRAMVGGEGFVPNTNEVNLALRRRQTGSSVKMFVLAAALEAGILPEDVIDGTLPCTLPNPGNAEEPTFLISNGVSEPVGTLRRMTALSINCAYARLAQVVGLERIVALMYAMTSSEFMPKPNFGTDLERANLIKPYASLSTGANELSPLDMASGAQTIANAGVHREPYAIERIEDANGQVLWRFEPPADPEQVLTRDNALRAIDVMKGVIKFGTARRTPLVNDRPAAGKTGTQDDNTNAWFVGFTPQLTTAVWVGDPKGYTPMVRIPEFVKKDGYLRVQGAMYPARIWKQYMDAAHESLPILDWDAPSPAQPTEARPDISPARVYLPGNECLATVVAGTIPPTTTTVAGKKTTTTTQLAATPDTVVVRLVDPPALPTLSTASTTTVPSPTTLAPDQALRQILRDRYPRGPVNTIPPNQYWVYECAKGLPATAQTVPPGQ